LGGIIIIRRRFMVIDDVGVVGIIIEVGKAELFEF